jgi:hypothetical protein
VGTTEDDWVTLHSNPNLNNVEFLNRVSFTGGQGIDYYDNGPYLSYSWVIRVGFRRWCKLARFWRGLNFPLGLGYQQAAENDLTWACVV